MTAFEIAVERVKKLNFIEPPAQAADLERVKLLMMEYLRRTVLWKKALQINLPMLGDPPLIGSAGVFGILARHINPSLELEPSITEMIREKLIIYPHVRVTLIAYLLWVMVENDPQVQAIALPPPFEPLIKMYEQGGVFYVENGFISVMDAHGGQGGVSQGFRRYDTDIPFRSDDAE